MREKARGKRRFRIEREMGKWEALLADLKRQREDLAEKIRQAKEEAYRLGRASVDAEIARVEIKDLEEALARMTRIREDLREDLGVKLKMANPPRAQPTIPKAEAERRDDISAKLDKILERLDRLENEVKAIKASKAK